MMWIANKGTFQDNNRDRGQGNGTNRTCQIILINERAIRGYDMLEKVRVKLHPLVTRLNLPTVIKTTLLPGDWIESIIIATQVGEIFYLRNGTIGRFLDIRQRILDLGSSGGGYDERGLLGLAFHPDFYYNGLFYLHYSIAGSQGPGALPGFSPNPCDQETLTLQWTNRETRYDHIDTVEEWIFQPSGQALKRRSLLIMRRPFMNHNGVNSLNFSPETGRLVLTTGDGGSGYDPFNLSQDIMEIAGKIIEIDVNQDIRIGEPPAATRFDELPQPLQETLTVIAKGVRNIPGISYQRLYDRYLKYVGNVGQDLVESIFLFDNYNPIPVREITQAAEANSELKLRGFINLGWRGWEGDLPTSIIRNCTNNESISEKFIAYYEDAIRTASQKLTPLTCYYHQDPRPNKFEGTALTGVQVYMGNLIPALTYGVVFTDFVRRGQPRQSPARGVLAYTKLQEYRKQNEYSIIEVDHDFGTQSAFYTCLGTSYDQTKLFLGVYGSRNVTDFNQVTVFEIIP